MQKTQEKQEIDYIAENEKLKQKPCACFIINWKKLKHYFMVFKYIIHEGK